MTLKQRKVAALAGKVGSMKEAMLLAGYSPITADTPGKVTKSKGWSKLMDEYLPDEELLAVHQKLLRSEDWQANSSGLDKAYKIKNKYADSATNVQVNVVTPILGGKTKE